VTAAGPETGPSAAPEDFFKLLQEVFVVLRNRFPTLFPTQPLPAGKVGPEVPFDPEITQRLFVAAAAQGNSGVQIWTKDDSELLVSTGQVKVTLDDGLVLVTIPVSCVEDSSATVQVPFAVGGKETPAGMVAATEERPRGPDLVVNIWGEALTAFAWQTFLMILTEVAAQSGVDQDGAGLIPAAITAGADGLQILTMARQAFDRVRQ
jgi:hypothetical protein